jgi:hypothetical protein
VRVCKDKKLIYHGDNLTSGDRSIEVTYFCTYLFIEEQRNRKVTNETLQHIFTTKYFPGTHNIVLLTTLIHPTYVFQQLTVIIGEKQLEYLSFKFNEASIHVCMYVYIQGVPGGTDNTSGGCSLGQTIPI